MSRHQTPITDDLARYVRKISVREPEPLRRVREESEDHPHASCQIAPEQGQFLYFLLRLMGARRGIEIGSFLGYSGAWMALALPPGGKLIACDTSEEYTARARRTWREAGVEDRVELRLAPALETLGALLAAGEAGTFDFVFIDADKTNYLNYYERAVALLRAGGLIAADNVLWKGEAADAAARTPDTLAIRAFNQAVRDDRRVVTSLATMGDGLLLALKL